MITSSHWLSTFTKPYYIQVDEFLYQMQANTIDETVTKVFALGDVSSQDRANLLAFVLTEHAIRNVNKTPIYVEFVVKAQELGLRKCFIDNCQRIYTNEIQFLAEYKSSPERLRCLGVVRLLAVLYLHGMLTYRAADAITSALFDFNYNYRLECYYEFVAIVTRPSVRRKCIPPIESVRHQLNELPLKLMEPGLRLLRETKIRLQKLSEPNGQRCLILGEFDSNAFAWKRPKATPYSK